MGQLMRQHWLPACLIEEIPTPDSDPIPIRLLGEDLVAFRDSKGRVGITDRYCPHRRASLVFGRNEDEGLRCLYHGWKINVLGDVTEMPSEPAASCLAQKIKHKAYATHEHGGFVWVYMGCTIASAHAAMAGAAHLPSTTPPSTTPPFTAPPFAPSANAKLSIVKIAIDCNWAQVLEGAIDSAHSSSLHSSDMKPARVDSAKATADVWLRPSTDKAPRLHAIDADYGFKYAALRRPISNGATHDYIRMSVFVAPLTVLIPPNDQYNVANINVPIDDTHTMFHFIAWTEDGQGGTDTASWRKFCGAEIGIDVDQHFNKIRTVHNNYLQDRTAMKAGNFTGIRGIPNQDIAMWETMGPIADRSNDRLGASDLAIVEFRKKMLSAVKLFIAGQPAIASAATIDPAQPLSSLRAFEGMVSKDVDWRTIV